MTIPPRDNSQFKMASIKPKIYLIENRSRQYFEEKIDELQRQGRLVYTASETSFRITVFVI